MSTLFTIPRLTGEQAIGQAPAHRDWGDTHADWTPDSHLSVLALDVAARGDRPGGDDRNQSPAR
jgi:hypothetical protein